MEGQGANQPADTVDLDGIAGLIDLDAETEAALETGESQDEAEQDEGQDDDGQDADSDQDESDEDDDGDDSEAETETLVHEGKEVKLKKSEVLELAQKGFDYTKKTMALAEERKALEPLKAQVQERLAHYEQGLTETINRFHTAAELLQSEIGQPPPVELATYDAGAYIAQKEAYQARVDKLNATYGHIRQLTEERDRARQLELQQKAHETEKYLVEHLPGWKDAPEKSLIELNDYIKGFGLSPETTKDAYVERGLWELAHKAREFDRLMERKATLKPKADLPKVQKPSANHNTANVRQQEAMKRFKSKPSLETLADLI